MLLFPTIELSLRQTSKNVLCCEWRVLDELRCDLRLLYRPRTEDAHGGYGIERVVSDVE